MGQGSPVPSCQQCTVDGICGKATTVRTNSAELRNTKSFATESFPITVMPYPSLAGLPCLKTYEEARASGLTIEAPDGCIIVFISHQWLALSHPDPNAVQLNKVQATLKTCLYGDVYEIFDPGDWEAFENGIDMRRMSSKDFMHKDDSEDNFVERIPQSFFWWDYFSIPQRADAREDQLKAIDSIPIYVDRCSYFFIVSPSAVHIDSASRCDYGTYLSRGWCRMELWANYLAFNSKCPVILTEREKVTVMEQSDFFSLFAQQPKWAVGCGNFTCCQLGHPSGCCDKERCLAILRTMWEAKLESLRKNNKQVAVTALRCLESKMFARNLQDPLYVQRLDYGSDEVLLGGFLSASGVAEIVSTTSHPCGSPIIAAAMLGDEKVLRACVDSGNSPNFIAPLSGATTLYHIATVGNAAAMHYLLSDVGMPDELVNRPCGELQKTALECAARGGNCECLELLLAHRADVHIRRSNGKTALHSAAELGHHDCVTKLVRSRAHLDDKDDLGRTPLHLCTSGFLSYGDQAMKVVTAQRLIEMRACVNAGDREGHSALDLANASGNVSVANFLDDWTMLIRI